MITIVPFKTEHWARIKPQPGLYHELPNIRVLGVYEASRWSITVSSFGRVVMCAGIVELWANRGECWCHLDEDCKEEFVLLFRAMRRTLFDVCPLRRIEATVEESFPQGHRMMELLGFKEEGRSPFFYPDGRGVVRYAHIRGA